MCSWATYDALLLLSTKRIKATFSSGVECYIKDKKIIWSSYLHIRISCTCNSSNWPMEPCPTVFHYNDVVMSASASPITSLTSVYSTVYSGSHQRKHQSSASLAFVRGIHRSSVNFPHKGPVTRKMFPFDDVIMPKDMVLYKILLSFFVPSFHDDESYKMKLHINTVIFVSYT